MENGGVRQSDKSGSHQNNSCVENSLTIALSSFHNPLGVVLTTNAGTMAGAMGSGLTRARLPRSESVPDLTKVDREELYDRLRRRAVKSRTLSCLLTYPNLKLASNVHPRQIITHGLDCNRV